MAIEFKVPEFKNIGKRKTAEDNLDISKGVVFGSPSGFNAGSDPDAFGVSVRNEAAGIKLLDEKIQWPWWRRELPHEIATGVALMSFFAFVLAAASMATTIPFLLAGVIVYVFLVALEEYTEIRMKVIVACIMIATLLALLVVFRKMIGGGLGQIMNSLYEASEFVQAYVYTKFPIPEAASSNPELAGRIAAIWASCLAGAIGALPPASARRFIGLGVAAFTLIAFAYYGLIPSVLVVVIAAIAILFIMSRGSLLAAVPVLLAAALFFGVIMAINPGESIAISRVDENIRDRLALRSAYLESNLEQQSPSEAEDLRDNEEEFEDEGDEFASSHKWLVPLLIILLILAALAATAYFMYKRYLKRRDANREGIDSEDIRTATIAMFRYAVRWLGASGIDVSGKSFGSLVEPLKRNISDQYSQYFSSMYVLWREAAYSDHEIDEEKRDSMRSFMNDTREMVEGGMDWRTKLLTAVKYAL